MSFTTLSFILFISVVILLHFLVKPDKRWIVLLLASYVFMYLNSKYLILIHFATVLVTFFVGKAVDDCLQKNKETIKAASGAPREEIKKLKLAGKKQSKRIMWIGIIIDLGTLLFLKYYNFFIKTPNFVLGRVGLPKIPGLSLLLPIGISFYTLQMVSYLADVQRGKYRAEKSLPHLMLFFSYFPQIVQGPIARYNQLSPQFFEEHKFDYKRLASGAQLILWGFIKKLVIADRIATPVDYLFDNSNLYEGAILFFAAAMYGIQVYADFSAGMDIARGFSEIIGIELELNFKQPYFAKSIEEFWRRWHITLGSWMRDYVFYPLSLSPLFGNIGTALRKRGKKSLGNKLPSFIAMFIVYFLVGFWHGANWKYIAYGIWNGIFISSGILLTDFYGACKVRFHVKDSARGWQMFQMLRTFILCSFGRIFSRANGVRQALHMFGSIITKWYTVYFITDGTLLELGLDTADWVLLLIAVVFLFIVDRLHERDIHIRESIARQNIFLRWAVYYAAIFIVLMFGIYGPAYDAAAFIYAQF